MTTRPLKVLYIDGLSGAKSDHGVTDSQDSTLGSVFSNDPPGDRLGAEELCKLAVEWEINGFLRTQPGFEIFKCDFSFIEMGIYLLHLGTTAKTSGY